MLIKFPFRQRVIQRCTPEFAAGFRRRNDGRTESELLDNVRDGAVAELAVKWALLENGAVLVDENGKDVTDYETAENLYFGSTGYDDGIDAVVRFGNRLVKAQIKSTNNTNQYKIRNTDGNCRCVYGKKTRPDVFVFVSESLNGTHALSFMTADEVARKMKRSMFEDEYYLPVKDTPVISDWNATKSVFPAE